MKIEWIEGEREVPKVGLMITGMIKDVEKEIGELYIKQGLARKVEKKKPKILDEGGED